MPRPPKKYTKRFARIHFWVMFFAFVLYLGLGFSLGPGFFKKDLLKKIHVLADDILVVTATVLGPPQRPVVTATTACISDTPRVTLDWADDIATETWNIERDGAPLSTGVNTSQYVDTAVTESTSHTYTVTALGQMAPGSNISDLVSITVVSDCPTPIVPTVVVQTVDAINVQNSQGEVTFTDRRPVFTGSTNIPYAIVDIVLHSTQSIEAQVIANANGYFSWTPPIDIDLGEHTLFITATDPSDPTRQASSTLVFSVEKKKSSSGTSTKHKKSTAAEQKAEVAAAVAGRQAVDFSVKVNNGAEFIFQGDDVNIDILSKGQAFPLGTIFRIALVDVSGKEVFHFPESSVGNSGETVIHITKKVPLLIDPGVYRVRVDEAVGDWVVSREVLLTLRAWPLLNLGGGTEVTYPEVASFVGTISFVLFSLFILFIFLFMREYLLYLSHIRHVTEYHLSRLGFFGTGKGVRS